MKERIISWRATRAKLGNKMQLRWSRKPPWKGCQLNQALKSWMWALTRGGGNVRKSRKRGKGFLDIYPRSTYMTQKRTAKRENRTKWMYVTPRWQRAHLQCRRHKRCGFDPWVGKIALRRKWQPASVFLPGESHGQRSLAGYNPWGRKE